MRKFGMFTSALLASFLTVAGCQSAPENDSSRTELKPLKIEQQPPLVNKSPVEVLPQEPEEHEPNVLIIPPLVSGVERDLLFKDVHKEYETRSRALYDLYPLQKRFPDLPKDEQEMVDRAREASRTYHIAYMNGDIKTARKALKRFKELTPFLDEALVRPAPLPAPF